MNLIVNYSIVVAGVVLKEKVDVLNVGRGIETLNDTFTIAEELVKRNLEQFPKAKAENIQFNCISYLGKVIY